MKLYTSVGWEPPALEQADIALKHTLATFTAYDGDNPVGMVRLLGDMGMSFYVKNFAVVPEYQSKEINCIYLFHFLLSFCGYHPA